MTKCILKGHCSQSLAVLTLWFVASSSTIALSSAASSLASTHLVGLRNLGNTCYLNAQLQCAYHIPLVRSIVLDSSSCNSNNNKGNDDEDTSDDNDDGSDEKQPALPTVSPALLALACVFADMAAAAVPTGSHGKLAAVSPIVLTRTLGIPVYEQQDSQEFWKLLLPALNVAHLTDLYQGSFQDYICAQDGSGRQRVREETFLDISLNVRDGGSVQDSLAETFGEPELLRVSEGNGWRPAKGEDKVDALKGSRLLAQGLPAILQLHLKRFNYDWNRDLMEKSNVPFSFEPQLDLGPLCYTADKDDSTEKDNKQSILYDLQGVVIHVGEYNAGHYYAYIRPNLDSDTWFRINDDEIDQVTWEDVITDAIGGMAKTNKGSRTKDDKPRRGFLGRVLGALGKKGGGSYGFGGSTSNAYVLQYVKRSERNRLYQTYVASVSQ